ncbi:MAG TPA: MBL fold metallo-hydrolase [Deltaproteobacteria bacterium]|nr:MBL fold metallo-hydrolase [Deltaproteobacteria bacterium]HOI06169.1 MBL fold metallo-hydrolase [Deltaproteobacteria bacterium]
MKRLATGSINEHLAVGGNVAYPGYVIKGGSRNLMIEAGLNLLGPLYLQSLGEILGSPERLDYLFVTHSHYDHLGAVPFLKRAIPGLALGAHERVAGLMRKESVLGLMNRLSEVQRPLFGDIAGDEDLAIGPVEFGLNLRDGDVIDLGGLTCRVYEVPGHTKDSLAFYIPELGTLFSGEAAGVPQGPEGMEPQVCFLTSYDDYLASLEKIIAIAPKVLCTGHGWILTDEDANAFLRDSLEATSAYRALIERHLQEADGDTELAIETIARAEYDEKGTIYQERNAYITNLTAQVRHIASLGG